MALEKSPTFPTDRRSLKWEEFKCEFNHSFNDLPGKGRSRTQGLYDLTYFISHSYEDYQRLHRFIDNHLTSHLENLKTQTANFAAKDILIVYANQQTNFMETARRMSLWISPAFHCFWVLHRMYGSKFAELQLDKQNKKTFFRNIERQIEKGRGAIPIYELIWHIHICSHEALVRAILDSIQKERCEPNSEPDLAIAELFKFFISVNMGDSSPGAFEHKLLDAIDEFYKERVKQYIHGDIRQYLIMIEASIQREKELSSRYVPHSNAAKSRMMQQCRESLRCKTLPMMCGQYFYDLLDKNDTVKLKHIYLFFYRESLDFSNLQIRLSTYIRRTGLDVVRMARSDDETLPEVYVKLLLQVHNRFRDLVDKTFDGNSMLVQSLDNACQEFVNRNAICEESSKSATMISRYIDTAIRELVSLMPTAYIDTALDQTVILLKYIEERHIFQQKYEEMLMKRLKADLPESRPAEEEMVSRLGRVCTSEYIDHLRALIVQK